MDFINLKKIKSWAKSYSGNYLFYKPRSIDEIKIYKEKAIRKKLKKFKSVFFIYGGI